MGKKKVKAKAKKIPDEKAYQLLKRYKIPVVPQVFCSNESSLKMALKKIGFPCTLKISGDIIHKTEVKGVMLNINNEEDALKAFRKLMKIKGCKKVLVQKQLKGLELIAGGIYDNDFGECVSFGAGGIFTEILKDVSFRVCPITKEDAEEMIMETKIYEVLKGYRGKKYDIKSLIAILQKISNLLVRSKIKEMDINPLFATEKGFFVVDVRMVK